MLTILTLVNLAIAVVLLSNQTRTVEASGIAPVLGNGLEMWTLTGRFAPPSRSCRKARL